MLSTWHDAVPCFASPVQAACSETPVGLQRPSNLCTASSGNRQRPGPPSPTPFLTPHPTPYPPPHTARKHTPGPPTQVKYQYVRQTRVPKQLPTVLVINCGLQVGLLWCAQHASGADAEYGS